MTYTRETCGCCWHLSILGLGLGRKDSRLYFRVGRWSFTSPLGVGRFERRWYLRAGDHLLWL